MEKNIEKVVELWGYLQQTTKPIVLYGMGDGAVKIKTVCEQMGIPIAGIFASDAYVRGHFFLGYEVKTLERTKEELGDFIILLAFAAFEDGLYQQIFALAEQFELYAPDVPVIGEGLFTMEYWRENRSRWESVYCLLADDLSKQTLMDVISFKLSGKISYLDKISTTRQKDYETILPIKTVEHYVDLGAYDGDTIGEVLSHGAKPKTIFALEPDAKNFKKLMANTGNIPGIQLYPLGSYSHKTTLSFHNRGGRNSALGEGGRVDVEADSVDNLLLGKPADFIKMDVEGAEYPTLLGCQETIKRFAPALAIAAYHRNEDLLELPLLLQQLHPNYQLYLRHNQYIPAWETILYAVDKSCQSNETKQ